MPDWREGIIQAAAIKEINKKLLETGVFLVGVTGQVLKFVPLKVYWFPDGLFFVQNMLTK